MASQLDGHLRLDQRNGSLRAFDLRPLERSTRLYETPPPKNEPPTGRRIAFNLSDPNYISTFHQDGAGVQILDMRSPGAPSCGGWSSTESRLVATADASAWFGVMVFVIFIFIFSFFPFSVRLVSDGSSLPTHGR